MSQKSIAGQTLDKKQTICRAFAFINYNIPPAPASGANTDPKEAFFTTIGFFDAMKTERLTDGSLCGMWKKNEEFALELDGRYSFQSTLGIREGDGEADDTFWACDEKHPLTFVTFFQMQGKLLSSCASSQENIPKLCTLEMLETCAADAVHAICQQYELEADSICFVCYMTLDKNDFIVGIKTDRFEIVSKLILEMHRSLKQKDVPTLYSYSSFSVNFSLLNQELNQARWFQELQRRGETIDTVCFKGIGNTHTEKDTFEYLYECYAKCLDAWLYQDVAPSSALSCGQLYEIIGDYDFQYIARDVPLANLLRAMYPGSPSDPEKSAGPLYYGSNILRSTLYASLLVLNNKTETVWRGDGHDIQKLCATAPPLPCANRCEELRSALERAARRKGVMCMDEKESARRRFYLGTSYEDAVKSTTIGSLSKLLGSLAALERAPTRKYDFETMYWPCRRLIEILTDEHSNCHEKWEDFNGLSEFIKSLSSTLHGTLRTDIQFFQINDFNAIVHYAPAKLRAFYSAWIYYLVRYYQCFSPGDADPRKYEFIIAPSNSSLILTRELTCNHSETVGGDEEGGLHKQLKVGKTGYRLMYVEMPERLLYQPEYSCVILAHEIAHFGGGRAKRRIPADCTHFDSSTPNDRFTVFLSCVSTWYALTCHSILLTELDGATRRGDANARLLRNILSAYLDTFQSNGRYAIEKTGLYQSVFSYLRANCSGEMGYAWECVSSAREALWRFVKDPVPGQRFSAATLASRCMELNLRQWLLSDCQDSGQWEELVGSEPASWTEALVESLMILAHKSFQTLEAELYNIIILENKGASPRIIKRIMNMIQEPHADLVGIFSLRLSPEQYFSSFLLSNNFPDAWSEDSKASASLRKNKAQYMFMRILAVVTTMKHLTDSPWRDDCVSLPETVWNAWRTLDWHTPTPKADVPESIRIICKKLQTLWTEAQMDDRCYLDLALSDEPRNQNIDILLRILYASQSILEQIVGYLTGCGQELLRGTDESRIISENLSKVYQRIFEAGSPAGAAVRERSNSVYQQAVAIDEELWMFENEQLQRFSGESSL